MSGNTVTDQIASLLRDLQRGILKAEDAAVLEQMPADEFVADVQTQYPIVFQRRTVGRKRELGLARRVAFHIVSRKSQATLIPAAYLLPVLRNCLFVSLYDNAISEVTVIKRIRVRPSLVNNTVAIKSGRGVKLDRTPDGWSIKNLPARNVSLTDQLLLDHGWRFEVFLPFGQ